MVERNRPRSLEAIQASSVESQQSWELKSAASSACSAAASSSGIETQDYRVKSSLQALTLGT